MITTLDIAMLKIMKKLSKEQIEKRKRIKQYLLRSLHIVSYVLSVLFIIVCIVVCVQSCKPKNKVEKGIRDNLSDIQLKASIEQGLTFRNIYYLRENGDNIDIPLDTQQSLLDSNDSPYNVYDVTNIAVGTEYSWNFTLTNCYLYDYESESFLQIEQFAVVFNVMAYNEYSLTSNKWRLNNIYFRIGSWQNQIYKNVNYNNDNNYHILSNVGDYNDALYFTNDNQNNTYLDLFYYKASPMYFNWSSVLRVNFPVAPSITSLVIQDTRFNNRELYSVAYDTPYFISNGQLFNRIVFTYITGYYNTTQNEVRICYGTNQTTTPGWVDRTALKNGQGVFTTMSYYNSDTDNNVPVYYRDVIVDNEGETSEHPYIYYVYNDKLFWTINSYQSITFIQEPNETLINNLDSINNGISSINPDLNGNYSVINVFTLISYAFTSLIPLLNIQLIPGMVIGTFIFIPLLVAIITILVRLVKK